MEIDKDVLISRILKFLSLKTSDCNGFFHLATKEDDCFVYGRGHDTNFYLYQDVDDFLEKLKLIDDFCKSDNFCKSIEKTLKNPFARKNMEEICIALDLAEDDQSFLDSSHAPCPKD